MSDVAPPHWIRRLTAAEILGVTYPTIVGLEKRGLLTPKKSVDGVVYYDPDEVAELREKYHPQLGRPKKPLSELKSLKMRGDKGTRIAAIIEHLEKGSSRAEIIKQLRCTFEEIDEVQQKLQAPIGSLETPAARAERLRKEQREHELQLAAAELQGKSLEALNKRKRA